MPNTDKVLTSNAIEIPFNSTYFEQIVPFYWNVDTNKADILAFYRENGYVLLKNVLPQKEVLRVRECYFNLFDPSMFKEGTHPADGIFSGEFQFSPYEHGHPKHPAAEFVKSEEFIHLTSHPVLQEIASLILEGDVTELPRRPIRQFYNNTHIATKAHCDYTYLDKGTDNIITIWLPLGNVPLDTGGLIYLKDSHKMNIGYLKQHFNSHLTDIRADDRPITPNLKALADYAHSKWLFTEYEAGDIILHSPHLIHATTDCNTDYMRLSTDIRFAKATGNIDPRWGEAWRGDDGY
ncbi:MAG: phytanoyl-CoA dioxygenase [Chitinophagia bacterium]|nr:phytanoyl-CoA dioxygenase [Chitinophagia bacterium]